MDRKLCYKLGVLLLLVSSAVCEESDDDEGDSFASFLNNLFGGWFDSESSETDYNNSTVATNTSDSNGLNTNFSTSANSVPPNFALDAQHAEVTNPPEGDSQQEPTKEEGQGFLSSLFGYQAEPESKTTTTAKPVFGGICQANPDLITYGQLPPLVLDYLQLNTTAEYLSRKIFNCDVVEQLQKTCAPGSWCLPSKVLYNFMRLSDSFLGGPLCSTALRTSLKTMDTDQEGCPMSKEIYNMHVALDLLCEIGSQAGLTYECFGHVMAMLHVNLADALRPQQLLNGEDNQGICYLQKGMQIKHYICIRDLCTYQTPTLNNFQPWQWFLPEVPSYEEDCKYDDVCGLQNQITSTSPKTSTTTTTAEVPAAKDSTVTQVDIPEVNNVAVGDSDDDAIVVSVGEPVYRLSDPVAKTKVLVGISSAVVIATFGFIMLICALYKRVMRHNPKRYNPSYSKLPNEEAQPLYQ